MSIKICGAIGIGYGSDIKFEYSLEDLSLTPDEWKFLSAEDKDEFLNTVLETEIQNCSKSIDFNKNIVFRFSHF